jgi:hypothetical protein|tara:strand:+ start:747 stop:941 length:195 start_codon:yes stop_codon:yes gene_type:complete
MTKYRKDEEDGSITYVYAEDCGGKIKTHNNKGPAIVNKKQDVSDYYLYGVKMEKSVWEKKSKFS